MPSQDRSKSLGWIRGGIAARSRAVTRSSPIGSGTANQAFRSIVPGESPEDRPRRTSRLEGYRRALATADIPFDPDLVAQGDWSTTGGCEATRKLLKPEHRPTAIFCYGAA